MFVVIVFVTTNIIIIIIIITNMTVINTLTCCCITILPVVQFRSNSSFNVNEHSTRQEAVGPEVLLI